jgi:hypothetical protein
MIEYRFLSSYNLPYSPTFRYVDDLIRLKNPLPTGIYPASLNLTEEGPDEHNYVHYLDLNISTINNHVMLYNKTDYYTFPVIHSMHQSCAISVYTTRGIIISQMIRFTRNNNELIDFLNCTKNIYLSHLINGHDRKRLIDTIIHFCNSRIHLLYKYNVFSKKKAISNIIEIC